MIQVCSSATGVVFKADWVMRLADVRLGVGTYLRDRWRMWGNLLIWLPTPRPLRQGVSARFPKHETEDVLLPLLASLTVSFHPLRNAAIKLSASFTTEFKMFFSGHGIHSYPEVVEVLRWHTQPDFKVKKLAFLQTLRERTEKRLWTFFCYQCAHIPASQLPRDLCPPSSGSGTAPRSRRCFRNWQLRLKFNPIFNRDTENQTVSFLFLLNEPSCSTRTTDINKVLS